MDNQEEKLKKLGAVLIGLGALILVAGLAGLGGLAAWYLSDPTLRLGEGLGLGALMIASDVVAIGLVTILAGAYQRRTGQRSKKLIFVMIVLAVSFFFACLQVANGTV